MAIRNYLFAFADALITLIGLLQSALASLADRMVYELQEKVFEGQKIKTLQGAPDILGVAVLEW